MNSEYSFFERKWTIIKYLLIICSVLAAIKLVFVDYTMDEEYQIMMAYRNIIGDHLFVQMWEPHQTSAFLCIFLMRIYLLVTGGLTGVIVFLRVCTTLIQIGISCYLYKVLASFEDRKFAFLTAIIYFNLVPKIIQIPEFSNMQVWFFTLLVLFMMQYEQCNMISKRQEIMYLVGMGICMASEVLSYPTTLVLFPFVCIYLFRHTKNHRWRNCICFCATCALSAMVWIGSILRNIGVSDFIENVKNVVNLDLTHEVSGAAEGKLEGSMQDLLLMVILLLISLALGMLLYAIYVKKMSGKIQWKKSSVLVLFVWIIFASELVQIYEWVIQRRGFENSQIYLITLWCSCLVSVRYVKELKGKMMFALIGSLLSTVAVMYTSDLSILNALPHGMVGPIFCGLLLLNALQKEQGKQGKTLGYFLLISVCALTIFGKGYTLRDGSGNTIWSIQGVMKDGPAKGIFMNYMGAYVYNSDMEDFQTYLQDGDTVLIVNNSMMIPGTTPYMFKDVNIAHYSIVDPTAYDERLLVYWGKYPEKKPNVIIVDCWYGELLEKSDSWIMQYIENEFHYTNVVDGKYVRFYRQ